MMHIPKIASYIAILSALFVVSLCPSAAIGGPLATTGDALNNGGGPDGGIWRGTNLLAGGSFSGDVDFAVFAPGSFQTFLDGEYGGGTYNDPTNGAEFIYAFQVAAANGAIQTLNAGLDMGADTGSLGSPQSFAASGDTGPNTTTFNDTSARWDWGFASSIAAGQTSDLLFYSSNVGPKPDQVTIGSQFLLDQADSGQFDYASPVPEPTSAFILFVGIGTAGMFARRKRERIC